MDAADPSDDRFRLAGNKLSNTYAGSVEGGLQPDLAFVSNVPHVVWLQLIDGIRHVYVCHLIDARPAQEQWRPDASENSIFRQDSLFVDRL